MDSSKINDNNINESISVEAGFTRFLLLCVILSIVGGTLQAGWAIGFYNTPELVIKSFYNETYFDRYNKPMSESTIKLLWTWTNAVFPLGATFSAISSSFVAEYLGRKNAIIFTNVFVLLAGILNIISKFVKSYKTLMVARFIMGIYAGLFTGIIPVYLSEISPLNLRGLIGTMNQLALVFGILLSNVLGIKEVLGTTNLWPVLVGLILVPIVLHVALFFVGVESPKYLFLNLNKREETKIVLLKLRGNVGVVENEIELLEAEKYNSTKNSIQVTWGMLVSKISLRRALTVAVLVMFVQQWSGVNAIIFYSTDTFVKAGLKDYAQYGTIILGVVQLVMSLVCAIIIEKLGRKVLLLIGFIGMCVSCFGFAISLIIRKKTGTDWLNWLTIVFAVLYLASFAIGPGPIPWLLTSELFDSDARAKANSIVVFVNWSMAFLITLTFPYIQKGLKEYSFFLFGGILIVGIAFILFCMPETKGSKPEDILSEFGKTVIFFGRRDHLKNNKIEDQNRVEAFENVEKVPMDYMNQKNNDLNNQEIRF